MKFGSLFTGVGGFDLALENVGMECAFQVEIDKQARQVLSHHWPGVPLHEDVTNVGRHNLPSVDLLVGGFPCQDLSVAGRRAGLEGSRSGLWWEYHRIIEELGPDWVLIENVPGLLSSNQGADFAVILEALSKLGYGCSWRVLDSQYFRVAQRRRRLFIVGRAGGFCPPEVLFESESLSGDPPPSREAGESTSHPFAPSLVPSGRGVERAGDTRGQDPVVSFHRTQDPISAVGRTHALELEGPPGVICFGSKDSGADAKEGLSPTLRAGVHDGSHPNAGVPPAVVAFGPLVLSRMQAFGQYEVDGTASALKRRDYKDATDLITPGPRRLTPTECERLQGFPDGRTDVDGMKDGPRYRMMGNAVTVNVIEWIGRRIMRHGLTERE